MLAMQAEIIPYLPDPDNTGEGKPICHSAAICRKQVYLLLLTIKTEESMKYSTITLLILLLSAGTAHLSAQTVRGVVLDSQTGNPLFGANVVQSETLNGTSTNRDGTFELRLIDGAPDLTIRFLGYRERTVTISDMDQLQTILLTPEALIGAEIFVQALRVDESTPIAYTNISREDIAVRNLGQDIPFLVSSTPSVLVTSDAGAGIGYTGITIRGVDAGRINVTINGIPLNDAESHGVFWVNMPDLASSTENIQIQRGVGTSTHGAGAFGATMNLQTGLMNRDPFGEINTSAGSFGTLKTNVMLGSGRLDNGWAFEGRLSKIESDGYIDRASSDLKSFYLSASRQGERSLLKADVFSGQERTYQAWNGVPEPILNNDAAQLEDYISGLFLGGPEADHLRNNLGNRRYNEFTYDNQVDNYQQDHYQLHYSYRTGNNWLLNTSLHYTYGRGYFEQFRRNDRLSTYDIPNIEIGGETITRTDLVRRRWLDNHFYGAVFSGIFEPSDRMTLTLGGGYHEYDGDHFGEVIWARFAGDSEHEDRYYDNNGFKTDGNIYAKLNYFFNDKVSSFADLQLRTVSYRFLGKRIVDTQSGSQVQDVTQTDRIEFFNPKFGVVYRPAENQRLFASVSVGGKEPTRREYVNSTEDSRPKPERLFDYELGYNGSFDRFTLGLNLYYMHYRDQLILTGAVNDVGGYIRENVPESYRAGIEIQAGVELMPSLTWAGNLTLSQNKIKEYTRFVDDFDVGGQQTEVFRDSDIAFSPSVITSSTFSWSYGDLMADLVSRYASRQYLDNTSNDARSIDGWLVHDLRLGYDFNGIAGVKGVRLSVQVNNLLNEKYVNNGYTFGWIAGGDEQFFNYYYPQAGRNVLAGLQVRF